MKKFIAIVLCTILFVGVFNTSVFASEANDGIMPRFNNVGLIDSSFAIIDGEAIVLVSYMGYPGITTGAKITTQLQKRSFLFFWSDVTEWVDVSDEEDAMFEHSYQVSSGTYRVKIKYEISGTGGATDVVEDELQDSY